MTAALFPSSCRQGPCRPLCFRYGTHGLQRLLALDLAARLRGEGHGLCARAAHVAQQFRGFGRWRLARSASGSRSARPCQPARRVRGGCAGGRLSPCRPAPRSPELCQPPRDVRRQRDGNRESAGSRPPPGAALRSAGDYQRQVLREPGANLGLSRVRRLGRPRSLQCQQGRGRNRRGRLPAFVLPARATPSPRSEVGQRAGGQRHRRRRLGQGPHHDRRGSPPPGRPARAGPQSAVRSALAARPGALERLPPAGRADAPVRRSRLVRRLELRPAPGEEIPVAQLVELFVRAWGEGAWQDVSDPQAPHEAGALRLCIDKAVDQLAWRPRWSVAEAVRRTAEWYRRFYASPSPDALAACRQDIEAYESSKE